MTPFSSSSTVNQDRQHWQYRLLESSLFLGSISFLVGFVAVAYFFPIGASLFLIIYSFLWLLKAFLNVIYTLYSYKQFNRWALVDWQSLIADFDKYEQTSQKLIDLMLKNSNKLDFNKKLETDISIYNQNRDTKFAEPKNFYNVAVFATYNEGAEVLTKSLLCLFKSGWYLDKLIVTVSQEARLGQEENQKTYDQICKLDFVEVHNIDQIGDQDLGSLDLSATKLNIFFTQHPDGRIGEIKGKASNEDWGARQILRLTQAKQINSDMILVTSLDADSHIAPYFFHNLIFRYCLTPDRSRCGFQPMHSYSNNFFETGVFPRLVATQTTWFNSTNLAIESQMAFFAIYSLPMSVLIEVDFWVKDVIGEDYMIFAKCLTHYKGDFRVVPHFGIFEGDAIEAEDAIEEIIFQYKQLQRWAWGGVEGFPYLFKRLFLTKESQDIKISTKIKWAFLKYTNHFFWSTTPIIFSIGAFVPIILHGSSYTSSVIASNLSFFLIMFSWFSYIFVATFGYLTIFFLGRRAARSDKLSINQLGQILLQSLLSPLIFGFMALPALDAQSRGLLGKYMGYWVTPKK